MRIRLIAVMGALIALAFVGTADAQQLHPHHHFHHALWELRDARKELMEAKHDFSGHKEKALLAIKDAIKQIDLILAYKGDNVKGVPTRGDLREEYKHYKHHPHLHHAVHELKHAHRQLKETKHTYDGHKEAAMRDIHFAIVEIEALLKHHPKTVKK
jgi:hypothetical protein